MTQKSGLAAVLAAITGKQPAGDAIPRADHMTAIEAAVTQAFGEGETSGKSVGMTAERTRAKAILGGENAKGREQLAAHFAFDTDMSADAANAALAAAPKAAEPAKGSRLDVLMPDNNPQLKEPGSTDPGADLSASLNGAVDNLAKQRGLIAH